jgi:hypothetical protein
MSHEALLSQSHFPRAYHALSIIFFIYRYVFYIYIGFARAKPHHSASSPGKNPYKFAIYAKVLWINSEIYFTKNSNSYFTYTLLKYEFCN